MDDSEAYDLLLKIMESSVPVPYGAGGAHIPQDVWNELKEKFDV